jgi:hypothetical protein
VGSSVVDLRETMSFATAADSYRWLNGLQGVSSGFVDMENGRMDVRVFRAQARTVESSVGALEG